MRLNPFAPNDNPMDQVLFCFGSGEETGGGSAGDFDDTVRLSGDDRPKYESEIEKAAKSIAGGDNYENVFANNPAAFAELEKRLAEPTGRPAFTDALPDMASGKNIGDNQSAPVNIKSLVSEPDRQALINTEDRVLEMLERQKLARDPDVGEPTRPPSSDNLDDGDLDTPDVDIFDTAFTGGATPADQIIEQARNPDFYVGDLDPSGQGPDFLVGPKVTPEIDLEIQKQAGKGPRDEGLGALLKPGGIVKNIFEDLTNRNAAFAREVQRPGNRFQRDAEGTITGVYNPQSNAVFTPGNVGLFDLKGQERAAGDLYDMQRAEQERRMGRAGDDQPVVASTAPMTPEAVTPEEVAQGFPITAPGAIPPFFGPYSPATQYTGIAGLPQFTLQPTYTAPTMFSPLYNIG